jgi:hypothetical protein
MKWAGHVARMGKKRNDGIILIITPQERISFWGPRSRWEVILQCIVSGNFQK